MCLIVRADRPFAFLIVRVLTPEGAVASGVRVIAGKQARTIVDGFRERVGEQEDQARRGALLHLHLQRVVVGRRAEGVERNAVELRERTARLWRQAAEL